MGIRIMLVAAAAALALRYAEPPIQRWVYSTFPFDFPVPPNEEELASELDRLIEDPARAESDPSMRAWLEKTDAAYLSSMSAFYVLDTTGRLVYRSPELALAQSEQLTANSQFTITSSGEAVGRAFVSLRPLALEGCRIGLFGRVYFSVAEDPRSAPSASFSITTSLASHLRHASEEGVLAEQRRHYERLRWIVNGGVALIIALVLGLLVSVLLSRRLVRLARQTETVDEAGVPGPFHVGGRDEIAALSTAMNAMRSRIRDLVKGLEDRDAARRDWVAQVSHDLRTPLTSLRVCLDRAQQELDGSNQPGVSDALDLARHDARRLQSLAEDLLDAARLEAGAPLELEPVLPREVMRDAIRSVSPIAESRGVRVSMESNGALEDCHGDGERLLRACENLLRNAVRHASTSVEVGAHTEDDSTTFWVRDDGEGFVGGPGPIDLREVRTGSGSAEGASLGLLVVERVAEAHGGKVELCNLQGGGAEARFSIASVASDA